MDRIFTRRASRTAAFAGHYVASMFALLGVLVWIATGPLFRFSESSTPRTATPWPLSSSWTSCCGP